MKEKIKRIVLIIFYIFIWLIFILSSFLAITSLLQLDEIKKWWLILAIVALPFSSAYLLRQQIRFLVQLAWKQKLILSVLLIVIGLFFWFQIRPAQIYSKCNRQAQEDAIEIAKNRAEDSDYYKEMAEKGFYITRDYDSAYTKCLRRKGIGR